GIESRASFKSHHLRAGRAEYATTLEPELWVQRCELTLTVSQRAGDDNLCEVSSVQPASTLPLPYGSTPCRFPAQQAAERPGLRIKAPLQRCRDSAIRAL